VLTVTGFVHGNRPFLTLTLTESTFLNRSPNIWHTTHMITPVTTTPVPLGGSRANALNITKFYLFEYLFLRNSPTGQTSRRIFALDGSTTRTHAKVSFGVSLILLPVWGVKGLKSPLSKLEGVFRCFQAKHTKY